MKRTNWKILLAILSSTLFWATAPARAAEATAGESETWASITPGVRYITVDGDENRFRQDWWITDEWAGGLEELTIDRKLRGDWLLHLEGRAIFDEEDYKVRLEIVNPEVGFLRAGYTEYRKYFDDSGGFYVFPVFGARSFELGQELHLDIGHIYVELGLTLPNWPVIVLAYEHKFKDGTKSMIEWGSVSGGGRTRNILPASKEIDETVDIFRVEVDHDIGNVHVGNRFRYEKYDFKATRLDDLTLVLPFTAPGKSVIVRESYEHDAFFNTFHMESHVNEKVYWSAGYLFSTLDGEPGFAMDTMLFPGRGVGALSPTDKFWTIREAMIDQDSHVLNVNAMFGPFRKTYFYGGFQAEKTETDAFSDVDLREQGVPNEAGVINTRNDKDWYQERVGVRYTGIPFTTLYAEGKWEQGSVALFEEEVLTGLNDPSIISETLQRFTDTDVQRQDYRIGFNTAPFRKVTLSAYYRYNQRENDYNNVIDQILEETAGGVEAEPQDGYSAFIRHQELTTDEIGAKLTVRPTSRLSVSFKYQLIATDIDTRFEDPAANAQSGNYDAQIYSVSTTVTPINRMYCTALFSYRDTRTRAEDSGSAAIITYEGDGYSVVGAVGYALDDKTDLRGEYSFSSASNFEDNSVSGLPLGIDYERHGLILTLTRRIKENIIARLRYGFYDYEEDSAGGINDYTAHLASASWTFRF